MKVVRRVSGGLVCAALIGLLPNPASAIQPSNDNPCPEGWYQDLSDPDRQCRKLNFDPSVFGSGFLEDLEAIHVDTDRVLDWGRRTVGFESSRFDDQFRSVSSTVFTVSTCTEEALHAALRQVGQAGGGLVELPSCKLSLTGELKIPSRTVLSGQGGRATVLAFEGNDNGLAGSVLRIDSAADVVVKNLGIERTSASNGGDLGIALDGANNVLIERVSLSGVRVGIWAQHSTNFTIRYSEIRDLSKASGDGKPIKAISFGECDQSAGGNATTASCEASRGFQRAAQMPTASMWTAGFAFYSNVVTGVESWGSSSASVGEFAGNHYAFGRGQLKVDDGRFVIFHHNLVESIHDFVVFRVATEITDRGARYIGFYENHLENNSNPGGYLLNFTTGEQVYVLNNRYRNNTGQIALRPRRASNGKVYACPLGEEAQPRDRSAHEGLSAHVLMLEDHDLLCAPDGGRYLFRE